MKIRLKPNHLFWVVMAGILILVLWWVHYMYKENKAQLTQLYNQQQLHLAKMMASQIQELFDEALRDLIVLSECPSVEGKNKRESESYMEAVYQEMEKKVTSLRGLDKQGILTCIISDEKQKKFTGRDYSRESYFEQPKRTGKPFISNVILEEDGQRRIFVSVPVYEKMGWSKSALGGPEKGFNGVLAFSIDLNIITSLLMPFLESGKTRNFWLLDDEGNLIVQPRHPKMELRNIFKNEGGCQKCHSSFEIQKKMVKGESGTAESLVKGSEKNLVAFAPINLASQRWSLALAIPSFEVLEMAKRNLRDTLILVLILSSWFLLGFIYLWQANKKKVRAEERIKEEQKYRNLVEYAHDAICIIQDEHFKFANRRFLDLSGYTWEELKKLDFKEVIAPEQREMVTDRYYRRQKGEKVPERYEFIFLTKNGERKYVELSVSLVEYQGKIASHGFLRDITERKKAEELLRTERDKLETVTKNIGVGLAIVSKEYRTLWSNQVLKKIFGDDEGKICYQTYNLRPEICPGCGVREVFEKGKDICVHEQMGKDKDGQTIWSQIVATPIRDKEGNIISAMEVVVPITERKRAEEVLQVSHHFLEIANWHTEMTSLLQEFVVEVQNFTGAAAVGLRILDEEGNIPYQAYEGFSREFYELESPLSTKSDQCMCINVIKGVTDPNLPFYTEGGSFYMNGTTRFLASLSEEEKGRTRNECNRFGYESVALVPIRLGERMLGLMHVADPHENMFPLEIVKALEGVAMQVGIAIQRVRSEEEIRKKNEELEAFVYMVSHDLKNPVVSIQGFCSSILKNQRDELNEKTLFYLQRVQANASLMASLLEDLVELSRIGRIEDKKTEISVQEVIKSVWAGVSTSLATQDVEFVCPENLPQVVYPEKRLYQIFSNLLSNAVKFKSENKIPQVEIGYQENKDNYTFFVRDNGIGIEQKYHNKIFDVFSQLRETESEGTGMGLAIVKKIVEANLGKVWVESQKGAGSTFYFTIPKKV